MLFGLTLSVARPFVRFAGDGIGYICPFRPASFTKSCCDLATQFLSQFAHFAAKTGHFVTKVFPAPRKAGAAGTARAARAAQRQVAADIQFEMGRAVPVVQADHFSTPAGNN